MVRGLRETVQQAFELTGSAVRDSDDETAAQAIALRATIKRQLASLLVRPARRLWKDDSNSLHVARVQMSIVDKLTHVYDLSARVACGALPHGPTISATAR